MSGRTSFDLSLYLVVDPQHCADRAPEEVAAAAAAGGASLVQLRDKEASTRDFLALARRMKAALAPHRVPLLINDRIDIALAAKADGVHIGQQDMPAGDARNLLGPDAIIGLTVQTLTQAESVPYDAVDYVSIGGVFPTTSKNNPNPPIGTAGFQEIAGYIASRRRSLPLSAIAGITAENLDRVIAAGADGVALVSAVCAQPDPQAAARALRAQIDLAKAQAT